MKAEQARKILEESKIHNKKIIKEVLCDCIERSAKLEVDKVLFEHPILYNYIKENEIELINDGYEISYEDENSLTPKAWLKF